MAEVAPSDLRIPIDAFAARLGDHRIITTLCPGGKERMCRLMAVIASGQVDLSTRVTHRFKLDDIESAYELFANPRDGVFKAAGRSGAVQMMKTLGRHAVAFPTS